MVHVPYTIIKNIASRCDSCTFAKSSLKNEKVLCVENQNVQETHLGFQTIFICLFNSLFYFESIFYNTNGYKLQWCWSSSDSVPITKKTQQK